MQSVVRVQPRVLRAVGCLVKLGSYKGDRRSSSSVSAQCVCTRFDAGLVCLAETPTLKQSDEIWDSLNNIKDQNDLSGVIGYRGRSDVDFLPCHGVELPQKCVTRQETFDVEVLEGCTFPAG